MSILRPAGNNNGRLCLLISLAVMGLGWALSAEAQSPRASPIRFEKPLERVSDVTRQMGGVNDMAQDHYGFIWIAAENGLGRYDGRELTLYQADPEDDRSLPGSYLWKLAVDREGVLWQGGEGGLSRYDVETDDFTRITSVGDTTLDSGVISAFAVGEDNTLYVGGVRRLYIINPGRTAMSVHTLRPPVTHGPNEGQVRSLGIDAGGRVWVATAGMGVAVFDPEEKEFEYLLHDPQDDNSLVHNSARSILHDDRGRVWMGTYGGGISRLDPETGQFSHFTHDPEDPGSPGSDIVLDILQDSEGVIWVALDQGGVARFDERSQSFHHYRHSPYDPLSIVSNQIRALYEDRNKDLWLGAFPSGVSYYNRSNRVFRHYTTRADDPASISHNAILRFLETDDGSIWVGTEGGLNVLDPATGTFRRYLSDPEDPRALAAWSVLALEEDRDGQLWVGTWGGGLHRFDPDTGIFHRYPAGADDSGRVNSEFIWDLLLDRDRTLWVATETGGLNRYHREEDRFSQYMHDPEDEESISGNYVVSLMQDRRGRIWVGTLTGLGILNPETGEFRRVASDTGEPDAIRGNNIRSLYEDSRGRVWVGTQAGGVNIYDPENGTFSHLDVSDGLPSANVSSIVEDGAGSVWLATANGLARLEPGWDGITTYGTEDGLAGSHFNRDASLRDRQGRLYFGSSEGITAFHPRDLDRPSSGFPVYLTRLRILNREVPVGHPDSLLQRSLLTTDRITLNHTDTMFSFDFAALNYRRLDALRYGYRLEGFDRGWNNVGQNATATYTNISPGDYRLRIRASTNGEHWIEGQSLAITILPPLWRTWWAYLLYVLALAILLLFAYKYITLRVRAEAYRHKSMADPLTQLYNRAGIAQVSEGIFANPITRKGMCLMLMDVDHFKCVNDSRGHDSGDRVLCELTRVVRDCLRASDYFGRWGGEEFILLCATQDSAGSRLLADKVRRAVENHVCEPHSPRPVHITVSIGVSDIRPGDNFESALKRADDALYRAKGLGRNRVVVAD